MRRQALQVLAQLPEAAAPMAAAGLPAYIHAGNLRRPAHAQRPATAPPALAAQVVTASDRTMPPELSSLHGLRAHRLPVRVGAVRLSVGGARAADGADSAARTC
jgi:hypothetical protein